MNILTTKPDSDWVFGIECFIQSSWVIKILFFQLSVAGGEAKNEQTESKEANEDIQAMIVNDPDAEDDDLLKAPDDRREDCN